MWTPTGFEPQPNRKTDRLPYVIKFFKMNGMYYIVKQLARDYGVKIRFSKKLNEIGGYFKAPDTIYISSSFGEEDYLETFFHELGHWHCYQTNKFTWYHNPPRWNTDEDINRYKRIALKAERYVDKWAEKECKKFFPEYTWRGSYRTKEDAKWLKAYLFKHLG